MSLELGVLATGFKDLGCFKLFLDEFGYLTDTLNIHSVLTKELAKNPFIKPK
jgi:hypothetical protein